MKPTDEQLREFARMVAPNLAWDLTRSEVYRYQQSETASATAVEMFIEQLVAHLKAKVYSGESFTVAIIPDERKL